MPAFSASGATMPRTSRSVAQRLASQQSKPKKRRTPRVGAQSPVDAPAAESAVESASGSVAPASRSTVSVDQILDEVVPSEGGARALATPTLAPATNRAPTGAAARRGRGLGVAKLPPVRRRYSEYALEYAYVWA